MSGSLPFTGSWFQGPLVALGTVLTFGGWMLRKITGTSPTAV